MAKIDSPSLTWLHLSDIHLGAGGADDRAEAKLVLDKLLFDVMVADKLGVPAPDLVFVTGDIVFSGGSRNAGGPEYARARTWLLELAASLHLGAERIFVVPGNHDVQRVKDADGEPFALVERLRSCKAKLGDALSDKANRAHLKARFDPFLLFSEQFAPRCHGATQSYDGLFWTHHVKLPSGFGVRLLGLNTAILANDEFDQGKLRLGMLQIQHMFEGLKGGTEPVILLSHHPLGWLADGQDLDDHMRGRVHLHLSGHVHDQTIQQITDAGGSNLVRIVAGAAHDRETAPGRPRYGYNFGSVRRWGDGSLKLCVWPFAWSDGTKDFRVDVRNVPKLATIHHAEFVLEAASPTVPPPAVTTKVPAAPIVLKPIVPLGATAQAPPITPASDRPCLTVYVVWHPQNSDGQALAEHLYSRLDHDVAIAAATGLGIPVHFRSEPGKDGTQIPREIDFDRSSHTAVVVLIDEAMMSAREAWGPYMRALWRAAKGNPAHRILPVALHAKARLLDDELADANFIPLDGIGTAERPRRLANRITHELSRLLLPPRDVSTGAPQPAVMLFLSHAKAEGEDIARSIKAHVDREEALQTFFDARDIPPGVSFDTVIEWHFRARAQGVPTLTALVAVKTDAYASREWCQREVLMAKQHRCPIVVVNAVERGEERSFPYLGNVPTIRWRKGDDVASQCQSVVDLALTEVLRDEFLRQHLAYIKGLHKLGDEVVVLTRPPELALLDQMTTFLYPDPVLGFAENALLLKLRPGVRLVTPTLLAADPDLTKEAP